MRGLGKMTDNIVAQPSASWKLRAMSIPFPGSVQTISVSAGFVSTLARNTVGDGHVSGRDMPCCFWNPSPLCILVSSSILLDSSSDSTATRATLPRPSSVYKKDASMLA